MRNHVSLIVVIGKQQLLSWNKMNFNKIWAWLGNAENQKTLGWLGGALIAVAAAGWTAYQKIIVEPKSIPSPIVQPAASQPVAAPTPNNTNDSGQQVNTGNISGGTVTINQQQ